MIYSDEGIYTMRKDKLIRMRPVDKPLLVTEEGFSIDNSYFEETEVDSQIPYDHVRIRTECMHFCVGKRSGIHLIVEGAYSNCDVTEGTVTTQNLGDKYYKFVPSDMYFYTKERVDNKLFASEVNVLLSIVR